MGHWIDLDTPQRRDPRLARRPRRAFARRAGGRAGDLRRERAYPRRGRAVRRGRVRGARAGAVRSGRTRHRAGLRRRRRRQGPRTDGRAGLRARDVALVERRGRRAADGRPAHRRRRFLLGRQRRLPRQHPPRPARGQLLRRRAPCRSSTSRLRAPMLFHFGERDPIIPAEAVAAHRAKQPAATIHVYPAGHGFNCEARQDFAPDSAALAWQRTTAFFDEALRMNAWHLHPQLADDTHPRRAVDAERTAPDGRRQPPVADPGAARRGCGRVDRPGRSAAGGTDPRDRHAPAARCRPRSSRTSSTSRRWATWCRSCTCT